LNVSKFVEKEAYVAVDKSVSQTIESRPSGCEEPMKEMAVLVEGEMRCDIKSSEMVPDVSQ